MKMNALVIILLFGLISMEIHGQYWVRSRDYFLIQRTDNMNSKEISKFIENTAPPALEYDKRVASQLSCFESSDGEIQIIIDPNGTNNVGTPPYYYTIDNGSPIAFTGTSTTVLGLGSTALQFKVFDSNDCTEKFN